MTLLTKQAIQTKFLGPTNTKGSRVKAYCQRGSIIIECDDSLRVEESHLEAVKKLCQKFIQEDKENYGPDCRSSWGGQFAFGALCGEGYVAVFTRDSVDEA